MNSEIIIDPEFRDLIPPLDPAELDQLHASLCGDGCMSPLIVWKGENILVDGHNRYAYLTKHDLPFEVIEMQFGDRETVKRFMILNQLGRRNVSPEMASKLRADYHASMSRGQGAPVGNDRASKQKPQNEVSVSETQSTAAAVAKATGVSKATVERDVQLGKALDKLGIPRNDYAAGKVLDAKGKKRSKGSIIAEAFPPKPKKEKSAPAPAPVPASVQPTVADVINEDESISDEYDSEELAEPSPPAEIEPWTIALLQLPKMAKEERQDLHDLLETRWDCKQRQS